MNTGVVMRLFALAVVCVATSVMAQQDETELAKKTQNPVADLISVPFQNNFNFNYGPRNNTQYLLNIQPVIPFHLNSEWNLITRTIVPVVSQPFPEQKFGLGDTQLSLFLSPAKPSKFIWGVGPILQFPTDTGKVLGTDKWGAGLTVVGLLMTGPWVAGVLANNVWSYAGAGGAQDINQFLVQPFINYNLPKGWYLSVSPIITANWTAKNAGDEWTVPVGGGIGKIFKIGKLPFNASVAYYYNAVRPSVGPDWSLRVQLTLLLPR